MKNIILFFMTLLVFFSVSLVHALVNPIPGSMTIPREGQTIKNITWNLSEPATIVATQSVQGRFFQGNINLGTVTRTLSTAMRYNAASGLYEGRVSEVVTIPSSVIKRAEQLGLTQFNYGRSFTGVGFPENPVAITVTSAAGGQLNISRMRLYFENQRGEITVNRNEKGLKAYADINYTGKGFFKGYWQVDNRVISYVNKNLVYGKKLTIETPDIPDLPTFIEGTHDVKFIIQSPDLQGSTMPKAIYYVRPYAAIQIIPIVQKDPYNMAPVDYSPLTLTWGEEEDLATYLVEFMDVYNQDPMFSAYTKNPEYTMPPYVLKHYFKERKRYYWKVKGFDSEDNIAGESSVREFRFKPK